MEKGLDKYEMRSRRLAVASELEKTDPILKALIEIREYTKENGTNKGFTTELAFNDKFRSCVVNSANTVEVSEWLPSNHEEVPVKHIATVKYYNGGEIVLGINDKVVNSSISESIEEPTSSKLYTSAIAYKVQGAAYAFPLEIAGPIDSIGPNAKKFISEFLEDAKTNLLR